MNNMVLKGVMIVMLLSLFGSFNTSGAGSVRRPAVAGTWYPADKTSLAEMVDTYIEKAENPPLHGNVIGLVSPHAGYVYSGGVAGHAYQTVRNRSIDLVILIGNAHRVGFIGAAIDSADQYSTPLGTVDIDKQLAATLVNADEYIRLEERPHNAEHSLEAQIPFLQRALQPGFKILPILFGYNPGPAYAAVLDNIERTCRSRSVLFIASTDLTHFPSYKDAVRLDTETARQIASMDCAQLDQHVQQATNQEVPGVECVLCGTTATKAVMELSGRFGAEQGVVLTYENSGDVAAGDKSHVVGYTAVAFITSESPSGEDRAGAELSEADQKKLLAVARHTIEMYLSTGETPEISLTSPTFLEKRGVFVTLKINGDLRGCIGYILPRKSLLDAVCENAINAAFKDPRFPPLRKAELNLVDIEISVLTVPEKVASYKDIRIGRDGVILKKGYHQAVFLPQVAPEQGWDVTTTLQHLSLKAGLSANGWKSDTEFETFQATVFGETEHGRQTITP